MDFHDLFMKLREKNKLELLEVIDTIEDFRDILLKKSDKIGDIFTPQQVVDLIKKDKQLIDLAKKIPQQGNLRKVVIKMAIDEFLRQ